MSAANEPAKKPVKNTKLKESLLKTIDGGKDDTVSEGAPQSEAASPFDEAGKVEPIIPANVTAEVDEALDKAKAESKKKPQEEPQKVVPRKKSKNGGGTMGAMALVFSLVAMGGAGYSVWMQQGNGQQLASSLDNVDDALGVLTSRVDDIHATASETQKSVVLNSDRLTKVESQGSLIEENKASLDSLSGELLGQKAKLDEYQENLKRYGQEYAELKEKYGALSKRTKASRKSAKKTVPVVKEDPSKLEGAILSSLDMWGTHRSAVLRNEEGQWVPLSQGDYYKGWRFTGIQNHEAVFKKGSKTRRLTVKE